jgi:hypothetical protein
LVTNHNGTSRKLLPSATPLTQRYLHKGKSIQDTMLLNPQPQPKSKSRRITHRRNKRYEKSITNKIYLN